jgi:hypothetical protein
MALTTNTNFLQPNGFRVTISRDNYPNLEFFAQSIVHPGINSNATDVPFRHVNVAFPGDKANFAPVSINVILDEDMTAYSEIVNWVKFNVENTYQAPVKRNVNAVPSISDIRVSILSSHNNLNKTILYKNAFPTDVSTINLEASTTDIQYITFTVDFKYDYWEFV